MNYEVIGSCISSVSYIKPQLHVPRIHRRSCCISSVSYIKPQQCPPSCTSFGSCISSVSYIKPQLLCAILISIHRCISSVSYIKPQRSYAGKGIGSGCISSVSYIKPQLSYGTFQKYWVVYRPFPTSNHNSNGSSLANFLVVYRPFPTSNHNVYVLVCNVHVLYIVRFLHQTTTVSYSSFSRLCCISSVSYIKPQPGTAISHINVSCISSVSYIKPQRSYAGKGIGSVVYRPFPTSNHNHRSPRYS